MPAYARILELLLSEKSAVRPLRVGFVDLERWRFFSIQRYVSLLPDIKSRLIRKGSGELGRFVDVDGRNGGTCCTIDPGTVGDIGRLIISFACSFHIFGAGFGVAWST